MHSNLLAIMAQFTWLQYHWYFGKENRKSVVCLEYVCLSVVYVDSITLEEAENLFRYFLNMKIQK
jgi:hypothetical protein